MAKASGFLNRANLKELAFCVELIFGFCISGLPCVIENVFGLTFVVDGSDVCDIENFGLMPLRAL